MSKLVKSSFAKSATFNHREHADRIDQLNTQAQSARRVDVALGLYCFELKEIHLQSGQFGRWLAEHKPHLVRIHESGTPQPSRSLETAMHFAKSALEVCGYQIGDFIDLVQKQFPRTRGNCCDAGQLMLLPADKLPEDFKKLQEEIFSLVDGKSKRQLLSEFKQVDTDGKPKPGAAKGSKGCTKVMRLNAKFKTEDERLKALAANAPMVSLWLKQNCTTLGFPSLIKLAGGGEKLAQIREAITDAHLFFQNHDKGGAK